MVKGSFSDACKRLEAGRHFSHSERRPPRPSQLAYGDDDNAANEEQKDRDGQIGPFLEFPEAAADRRRSSEKYRAHE